MEKFQHDDWEFIDTNEISVMVRSRGGSKTFDFTNWLIFRVLRTSEVWVWLSCKSGQLDQALFYCSKNPFVQSIRCLTSGKYDVTLLTGDVIRFGIISTSNLGKRVDGIIFDEFEDLQEKQEKEIYPQMEGMMTVSKVHKTIYLGTLWINTLLNEYVDEYPSRVRPWDELPWLVEAGMIQTKIDEGKTPEWQIDMLYRCIASSPEGLFFDQSHLHILGKDVPMDYFTTQAIRPNANGVDFNGGDTGHVLLQSCWNGVNLYAFSETTFKERDIPKLSDRINEDAQLGIYTEVEGTEKMGGGGYNAGFADHLVTLGTLCSYNFWEDNSKQIRLNLLQRAHVYVHPSCKWLIKNYKEASYEDKLSRTHIGEAIMKKRSDQHGLDCGIHCINTGGALDVSSPYTTNGQGNSEFADTLAMMRYR